jgi:mono/diheme cytochrome c family protein
MPIPEPISDASGMTGYAAEILEHLRLDRIVGAVHHHLEALFHELLRRVERFRHVGVERMRVAEHLELDEVVPVEQLARKAQRAQRILRAVAARGVRQDRVARGRQEFEQARLVRVLADVGAPDRDGHDLGAGRFDCRARLGEVLVLAGADEQARAVRLSGDDELVFGHVSRRPLRPRSRVGRRQHHCRAVRAAWHDLAVALHGDLLPASPACARSAATSSECSSARVLPFTVIWITVKLWHEIYPVRRDGISALRRMRGCFGWRARSGVSQPPPGECPQPRFTGKAPDDYYGRPNPLVATPEHIAAGRRLYEKDASPPCQLCHGVKGDGKGSLATQFDPRPRILPARRPSTEFRTVSCSGSSAYGSPETSMPGFKRLSDEQIWQIILYLRNLARP